jgi:hypothetical protein
MSRVAMVFTRGEDFVFGVNAERGTVADIASISANAKRAGAGLSVPPKPTPDAFVWTITRAQPLVT